MRINGLLKGLGAGLLAFGATYLILVAAMALLMPHLVLFGDVMGRLPKPLWKFLPIKPVWNFVRDGKVQVGDPAPDFDLPTADHLNRVRLSSFRGSKPVILIFGSYT
jgi:hypothetical protein